MKTHTSPSISSTINKENAISSMDSTLFTNSKRIKDIPTRDSVDGQEEEMNSRALRICKEHLGGVWKKISPADMSFTPISGGMSNALFCCSLPDSMKVSNGEPSKVLLRLYGNQFKNCDMSTQVEIFNILSMNDLGPKLYGKFNDGRLEEFLPATPMTNDELMNPEISAIIAKKLATVHSLDVPIIDRNNIWLIQRFREYSEFVRKQNLSNMKLKFKEGAMESTKNIARELMAINYNKEIKFLNGIFNRTQSPIVFSHNDLHQGNILLANNSKKRPTLQERIVFIDFEYCSYNYRAYDIANHLCEWCFQYDTPEYPHFDFSEIRFPNETVQREFVRNYLEQKRKTLTDNDHDIVEKASTAYGKSDQFGVKQKQPEHFSNGKSLQATSTKRPALNNNSNGFHKLDLVNDEQGNDNSYPHFEDTKKLRSANGCSNRQLNGDGQHYRQVDINCDTNGLLSKNKMNDTNALNKNSLTITGSSNSRRNSFSRGQEGKAQVDEVTELYDEYQPFFMMANFLWTLWSIKSAQCSQINFGYWEHAMARWQLYRKFKSIYVEQQLKKSSRDQNDNNLARRK